jgi:CRP-like cAMP-binding protein
MSNRSGKLNRFIVGPLVERPGAFSRFPPRPLRTARQGFRTCAARNDSFHPNQLDWVGIGNTALVRSTNSSMLDASCWMFPREQAYSLSLPAQAFEGWSCALANALTRRLEEYTPLTDADRAELARLCAQSIHTIQAKRDLIREGDAPRSIYIILEGWACHYRTLEDGRRQIVDFAIPGDLCDLNLFILDRMDHSICAITRLKVAEVGREVLHRVVTNFPNITTALWWVELVSKSIHREWIVNVGQRSARERIAHLLCEMFLRLESVGLTDGFSCDFPLTQNDIAETTGLTAVHVNRTIQELRRLGLMVLERRRLTIPDMLTLQSAGLFNPDYLHIRRLHRHTDAGREAQEARNKEGR